MTFGERLRLLRNEANLTQDQLAEKMNASGTKVQKQSISRYENSDREPNINTAKAMADALGVSLDVLAGLTPDGGSEPSDEFVHVCTRLSRFNDDRQQYYCRLFMEIMDGKTIEVVPSSIPDGTERLLVHCWNLADEDDRLVVLAALRKYGFVYQQESSQTNVG